MKSKINKIGRDKYGDKYRKRCGYQHKKITDFFTTKELTGNIQVRWGIDG